MFKKTKEKINNNEYVIIFKKLWDNKRYRSILILVIYFIFFGIIIGTTKSYYKDIDTTTDNSIKETTIIEKMKEWDNFENDYHYKILSNEEEVLDVYIKDGIVNLTIDEKNYTIINNNIYLNKNDDLKKINQIDGLNISLPITKLNLKNIMDYLRTLEINSYEENIIYYYVPTSYFIDDSDGSTLVEVVGNTKLEEIIINYQDEKISLKVGV